MSRNDEPVYDVDYLGHRPYVRRLGELIKTCDAPYVIGVSGSWGSGKTSFMRSLSAYLGGPIDGEADKVDETLRDWFGNTYSRPDPPENRESGLHVICFDPWRHQFEDAPLVGLLHEIRSHFSLVRKVMDETGKLTDVTTHSLMRSLTDFARDIKIPIPGIGDIMERGREYEADHFETPLTSQRFREFFEKAVATVVGPRGRLVILIDDLDRCEGPVAFRVLEALKLYLSAKQCVFVLGIDTEHLEASVAGVLSKDGASGPHRARNYLNKMFQNVFLLPVRKEMRRFVMETLDVEDRAFHRLLTSRFGLVRGEWPTAVVEALNQCLPHNPRKIKGFIAAWKLYVDLLAGQTPKAPGPLDWRLTVIFNYLGQFEQAIFRKVEESPSFYNDVILRFCQTRGSKDDRLEGLEMPDPRDRDRQAGKAPQPKAAEGAGGLDAREGSLVSGAADPNDASKPGNRVFWIGDLVLEVEDIDAETLRRHLLGTV